MPKMGTDPIFVPPAPRLAVSVAGAGELVLFLHGIRGNRHNWKLQLEAFAKYFRAVAWDARGYGDSDDYEGPLAFDDFTADVLRVVDYFEAPSVRLVGVSMGGRIARNFALRHPVRVKTLTLASTSPGFDALTPEQVQKFIADRRNATHESLKRLLGSKARAGAFEDLMASVAAVREKPYLKTLEASVAQDRAAPLEQIRAPTLVVAGSEDSVYPLPMARDIARRIPGAELAVMEGAGHLVNLEQPEHFNDIVLAFLRRHC